jgi:hypothetical protein
MRACLQHRAPISVTPLFESYSPAIYFLGGCSGMHFNRNSPDFPIVKLKAHLDLLIAHEQIVALTSQPG